MVDVVGPEPEGWMTFTEGTTVSEGNPDEVGRRRVKRSDAGKGSIGEGLTRSRRFVKSRTGD